MTAQELKNFFRNTLVVQRTRAQEFTALDAIVDFIMQSLTEVIPAWADDLTFQTDGTNDGTYCTWPDTNGDLRFWKTLVDDNINHEPPTNPAITEDAYWIEVSPSDGSAIKSYSPGLYGEGLILVVHDHSIDGTGLYILVYPTRPFLSLNIEDETPDKWVRITGWSKHTVSTAGATITFNCNKQSDLMFVGSAAIAANKIWALTNDDYLRQLKFRFTLTAADLVQTMPAEVKMLLSSPVGAWDSAAKTWTPTEPGDYEAEFSNDGTTIILKIYGPV